MYDKLTVRSSFSHAIVIYFVGLLVLPTFPLFAEHDSSNLRITKTLEKLQDGDELRGSVKFKLRTSRGVGWGYGTLIGFKRLSEERCKFIFLTAAHTITFDGRPEFERLFFASALLKSPASFRYVIHPEILLETQAGAVYKNDLALFSVEDKCPKKGSEPIPFRLSSCSSKTKECIVHQIAPKYDDSGDLRPIVINPTKFLSKKELSEEERKQIGPGYLFKAKEKGAPATRMFDSGSALFEKENDEYRIIGCLVAGYEDDGPKQKGPISAQRSMEGLCHGGPELLRWVAQQLNEELDGRSKWTSWPAGESTTFPIRSIPMERSERERRQ